MMARYIDADGLTDDMMCVCTVGGIWGDAQQKYTECFQRIIDRQKTADVRENVRGKWEYVQYDKPIIGDYHCSVCHAIAKEIRNFCPNCGAEMRGGNG